jgi:hypothetical protein
MNLGGAARRLGGRPANMGGMLEQLVGAVLIAATLAAALKLHGTA